MSTRPPEPPVPSPVPYSGSHADPAGHDSGERAAASAPVSPRVRAARSGAASLAILAAGAIITGLYWFADILRPLALAIFLWLTIDGFADAMQRRLPFLPRKAAIPAALVVALSFLAAVVAFVVDYAASLAGSMSAYRARLDEVLAQGWALVRASGPAPTVGDLAGRIDPAAFLRGIGDALQTFGSEALFVVIYVACLFAAQSALGAKTDAIFAPGEERERAVRIATAIRTSMESYLWVQTVTGLMIAGASWLVFALVGLDNALFWALVIFLLSYIPVIGGLAASLLPALFALVQFPTPVPALVILAATQAIGFVVGNIIQPRMTGDSLNISILMVFLSLAVWGKLWGGPGMFLAVPLTVMAMIVLAQFETTRWIAVMISSNGRPDGSPGPSPALKQEPAP
jgi:AI-2 transport protein TqsA